MREWAKLKELKALEVRRMCGVYLKSLTTLIGLPSVEPRI